MAEFKLGRIRFVWQGAWGTGTTYAIDDVISKGGKSYICVVNHVAAADFTTDLNAIPSKWNIVADGTTWRGDWAPNTGYDAGDEVKYGGVVYICQLGHTSAGTNPATITVTGLSVNNNLATITFDEVSPNPFPIGSTITVSGVNDPDPSDYNGTFAVKTSTTTSVSFQVVTTEAYVSGGTVYTFGGLEATAARWETFAESFNYLGNWSVNTRYKLNDFVTYGGFVYICKTPHVSATTVSNGLEADQQKWEIFNQGIHYLGNWNSAGLPGGANVRYKLNDVVKWGADLWICTTDHTSSGTTIDIAKFEVFVNGFQFENSWSGSTTYQIGDTVTYGGYSYIAKTNNINQQPTTNADDWDVFTTGFNFRSEWDIATAYKVGDVVRVNGYTYVANTDNTGFVPPDELYWSRLNSGIYWTNVPQTYAGIAGTNISGSGTGAQFDVIRSGTVYNVSITTGHEGTDYAPTDIIKILGSAIGGITPANDLIITVATVTTGAIDTITWSGRSVTWTDGTVYVLGDAVLFGGNSYICVQPHTGASLNRPDNDISATYWNVLTIGSEVNVLTTEGDMIYYGPNGPTRLPVGVDGQILRSTDGFPAWANYGLINNLVYVGPLGRDVPAPDSGLTIDKPWKTVRYANKQVEEGYQNPKAKSLLQRNKQFFLKEVENYLYNTYQATVTGFDTGTYRFTCASNTGLIPKMPISFSGDALGGITLGTTYYVCQLFGSTEFTISDTYAIAAAGTARVLTGSATGTMTGRLSYDRVKTERDTGYIVDAITYDLTRGGTSKTVAAGRAYFNTAGNAYITTVTGYLVPNFIGAHVYLKTLLANVLANIAPVANYQSLNGVSVADRAIQTIDTSITTEASALGYLTSLVDIISNALDQGSSTALPIAIQPNTTIMIKTGTYAEILPIYVSENTALVGDELRTSVVQPAQAIPLLAKDKSKTISALNRISSLMPDLMTNATIVPTAGNTEPQVDLGYDGSIGSTLAITRATEAAQTVYDILASGVNNVPTLKLPTPTNYNTALLTHVAYATTGNTSGSTLSYGDSRAQIVQNYDFIKAEIAAWLADAANGYDTLWAALGVAGQASTISDIGHILDAVRYDMTYGGNTQTLIAGSAYFSYSVRQIRTEYLAMTLAAQGRLKAILNSIANKNTVIASPGNVVTQVTTGTVGLGGPYAGTFVQDRVQNITDYVNTGTAPTKIEPCQSWIASEIQTAYAAVVAARNEIASDANVWIKKFFQEVAFNSDTSQRDAGYIVDAIAYDLLLGSNFASIKAGLAFYRPTASAVFVLANQSKACLGAINFIKHKLPTIAASGASAQAQNILAQVVNHIPGGAVPRFTWPNPSNIDSGYAAAAKLIFDNRSFIQAEIGAYLTFTYPSLEYSQAICLRDVGYIVDAFVYDLKYGGNSASKQAGKAYYSFGQLQIYTTEKAATLDAYARLKSIVQDIAVDTAVTATSGNAALQIRKDDLQLAGSAGAATQAGVLADIVTNIIDLGDSGVPKVTITTIAGGNTFTSGTHGLKIGDMVMPQSSDNGLVLGTIYYVKTVPLGTTFTLSATWKGTEITTFTNGTGLNIVAETTIMPVTSHVSVTLSNAFTTLNGFKSTIQTNVTGFITENYPTLSYNPTTCLRDVGYVIDAIGYDMMLGTNFQSVKAAMSYYRAQAAKAVGDQKRATVQTFRFLRTEITNTLAAYSTTVASSRALMATLIKIIDEGIGEVSEVYGTLSYKNDVAIAKGAEILRANADFLAAEATAWVNVSFGATVSSISLTAITTSTAHKLSIGDPVKFTGESAGGITVGTTYYVLTVPTNTTLTLGLTSTTNIAIPLSVVASPNLDVRYFYNEVSCKRDMVEFVLALVYDLQFTGNYKSLRAATLYKHAVEGSTLSDMFLVRNACGIRNMTLNGLNGDMTEENDYGTKRPTAGAYTSLDPGFGPNDSNAWVTLRSCYTQNVSLFGTGCSGMKIDGALHAGGNRSIVANDYTTILSDGLGVWCTGHNALTELVSVFCYYSYSGYLAELGGRMRATNGNSSYGTYGVIAEGTDTEEIPLYGILDNRASQATVQNVITDGINKVLRFEYLNAGGGYTNYDPAVSGAGYNTVAVGDEFRDSAVFEARLIDRNDGNGYGGTNYGTAINAAQLGDLVSVTISATDIALSTAYIGMRVHLTAGSGVGQYANILDYSNGTKVAKVYKDSFVNLTVTGSSNTNDTLTVASTATLYANMPIYLGSAIAGTTANTVYYVKTISNGTTFTISETSGGATFNINADTTGQSVTLYAAGWDHVVPGTALVTPLDLTTTYIIEPRITYSAPGFTATARTLSASTTWGSVMYGANRFVSVATGGTATGYSTNGTSWEAGGVMPSSAAWIEPVFGGGFGATATATVGGLGGAGAVLTAVLGIANSTGAAGADQVASITIVNGGYGYTSPPTIVFTSTLGGANASAICQVLDGAITGIQMVSFGSGYVTAPTVSAATDRVTVIHVDTWGRNYLVPPTITFSGGGASVQATATALISSSGGVYEIRNDVDGVTVYGTPGSGYTSAPTVTITDTTAAFATLVPGANTTAYLLSSAAATANWTAGGTLPATTFTSIAYGNGVYAAVGGTSSAASTAALGSNWSSRTIPTLGSGVYSALAYGGATFVAISSGSTLATAYSTNGTSWTAGGNLPAGFTTGTSITYGNGRFVALATSGHVAYSVDAGLTWTSAPSATGATTSILTSSYTWIKVRYGQGLFFAIATGSVAATSPDGINWTTRGMPSSSSWSGIAFGNPSNNPIWVSVSATSGQIGASMLTGARALGRMRAVAGTLLETRIIEPGSGYPKGTVTATTVTTNLITVDKVSNLVDSQPIEFIGLDAYGLLTDTTYYVIGSTISGSQFKVSATAGSSTAIILSTGTSTTATYRAAPIITQTDPNKVITAGLRARTGDGALGNPTFTNRGTLQTTATALLTGDGYADFYQATNFISVNELSEIPQAGSNIVFSSIPGEYYKLVTISNILALEPRGEGNYSATFQISPALTVLNAPAYGDPMTITIKYSQVRLTGHDFLYIGTGNQADTNYPFVDPSTSSIARQTEATGGGRVFFTSTDQDGNFNVGGLFGVQQATGTATLNANAFNLSGLQSLQLSGLSLGVGSATITQFSTDPYFTANSDNVLPTQRAIKSYITAQIGGGLSQLNVNTLTAGVVYIANNTISTTSGGQLRVTAKMNFTGGIDGAPVALGFFLSR